MALAIGQLVVFCLGLYAGFRAVVWLWFFSHSSRKAARPMLLLLTEQIVSVTGVLFFSSYSLASTFFGIESSDWNAVPPLAAQLVRFVMFSAMIHSTNAVAMEYNRILNKLQAESKS